MREAIMESGVTCWFQDVAALTSIAAMGWSVLFWGQIAETLFGG